MRRLYLNSKRRTLKFIRNDTSRIRKAGDGLFCDTGLICLVRYVDKLHRPADSLIWTRGNKYRWSRSADAVSICLALLSSSGSARRFFHWISATLRWKWLIWKVRTLMPISGSKTTLRSRQSSIWCKCSPKLATRSYMQEILRTYKRRPEKKVQELWKDATHTLRTLADSDLYDREILPTSAHRKRRTTRKWASVFVKV